MVLGGSIKWETRVLPSSTAGSDINVAVVDAESVVPSEETSGSTVNRVICSTTEAVGVAPWVVTGEVAETS